MLTDRHLDKRENPQVAENRIPSGSPNSPFASLPPSQAFGDRNGGNGNSDTCAWVIENFSDYMDNALNPETAPIIEAHLVQCANCVEVLKTMKQTDRLLEREWRESAPLPSSLQHRQSVDAIMAALPPVPDQSAAFATKRIHAKTRWTRLATGLAGVLAFFSLLWSSYRLGYTHGQKSHSVIPSAASPQRNAFASPTLLPATFIASPQPVSSSPSPTPSPPSKMTMTRSFP